MSQLDMKKQIKKFREITGELMSIEQRFQQLVQLAQQLEAEQTQLKFKAQHLSGMLEVLRELIPEGEQEKIIADVRKELEAQQAASAVSQASAPMPLREAADEAEAKVEDA